MALLAVLGAACGTGPKPRPEAEAAVTSGRGSLVDVELVSGEHVQGELIAISDQQTWVLPAGGQLVTVPTAKVKKAVLGVYRTNEDGYMVWTILGALSTISHGLFLIFSLPIWVGVGVPIGLHESNRGYVGYPPHRAEVFRMYARFPQGIPPGVDGKVLRDSTPWLPPP